MRTEKIAYSFLKISATFTIGLIAFGGSIIFWRDLLRFNAFYAFYLSVAVVAGSYYLIFSPFRSRKLPLVARPPGWKLRHFAKLCFSKKTYTQVLEPALCDLEKEYFDALHACGPRQARMSLVRNYWAFWSAVVTQLPISLARRVYEVWKATKIGS